MKGVLGWIGRKTKVFFRSRRRIALSVIFVLLAVAVAAAIHYLNAPATGHSISNANAAKDAARLTKSTTASKPQLTPAQTLSNTYFSLALPPGYNVQKGAQTPASLLYTQTITKPGDFGSLIIAIGIQELPSGGLSGDTSYTFRLQQPAVYGMTSKTVDGGTVHIASDVQTSSVVAFWPHGSYLGTISVSSGTDAPSGDNNADALNALQPLLSAWQWQ